MCFFLSDEWQSLEALLPSRRPHVVPVGEHVDEVELIEFDPSAQNGTGSRREAYHEDDSDDEVGESGMHNVQCAHQ